MLNVMKFFNPEKKPGLMVCVSAVLAALPLTFSSCFVLSWVAFVPFFCVVLKNGGAEKPGESVRRWFLFGFLFNLSVYYWFCWLYPLDSIGFSDGFSLFAVIFAWATVSFIQAVFYIIPGIFCHIAAHRLKNPVLTVFTCIVGIMAALQLCGYGEMAFPWIRISLGHYRVPVLIQSAALWGVEGLDFLILAVNGLLALAIVDVRQKQKTCAAAALGIFVANFVFGVCMLNMENGGDKVSVLAVQGNVPVNEKWEGKSSAEHCFDLYSSVTRQNVTEKTQLVVWPETAVPVNPAKSVRWKNSFSRLSAEIGIPIYMGVNWRPEDDLLNSAVLVDGDELSEPCSKRMLVPFGERLPFGELCEKLLPFFDGFNFSLPDYLAADSFQIMETDFGRIGSIICFESIFPEYSRENSQHGAEALFVITNDAWLEDSPATEQHLAHSVFRSVENSKETVRCANVGASAFIDSHGRIKSELRTLERGTLSDTVVFSSGRTVYNSLGYMFFPVMLMVWIGCCIFSGVKNAFSTKK